MYGRHPMAAPVVRKQHRRKVHWRTKAEAFDPTRVSRSLSPSAY